MKTRLIFFIAVLFIIGLSSCQQEYCTVKGTVQGSKVYKDYGIEIIPRVFLIDCRTGEILVHESHPGLDAILSELLP